MIRIKNISCNEVEWELQGIIEKEEDIDIFLGGETDGIPAIIELRPYLNICEKAFILKIPVGLGDIEIKNSCTFQMACGKDWNDKFYIESQFQKKEFPIETKLYVLSLKTSKQGLDMNIKKKRYLFEVSKIKYDGIFMYMVIQEVTAFLKERYTIELHLRKRVTENLWQYCDLDLCLGNIEKEEFDIKIPIIAIPWERKNIWGDFYIVVKGSHKMQASYFVYLSNECSVGDILGEKHWESKNTRYEIILYKSNGNNLSLKASACEICEIEATHIDTKEDIVTIEIQRNDWFQEKNIFILFRKRTYNDKSVYFDKSWKHELQQDQKCYHLSIKNQVFLRNLIAAQDEFWDIFIEIDDVIYPLIWKGINNFQYFDAANGFKLCFFTRDYGKLSLYTHEGNHQNNRKIKVGVVGTCFSRSVFKSDKYFNPDYKRFYDCVLTQFHSSLISLASISGELSTIYNKDELSDEAKLYLPTEIFKDFFERVEKSKISYLILDNYIDATRPIIQVNKNSFLTYNKYLIKSSLFRKISYDKIIQPGTEEFYLLYKEYAQKFVERMIEFIPENHILLLQGRFSYKIYDEKKNLLNEWPGRQYIQNQNVHWDEVDNILLNIAPKIRIIDMRNTRYYSDANSPMPGGASPSHYQSYYYKEILDKVNKIILEDKLN